MRDKKQRLNSARERYLLAINDVLRHKLTDEPFSSTVQIRGTNNFLFVQGDAADTSSSRGRQQTTSL